jgi:hypothetical protein
MSTDPQQIVLQIRAQLESLLAFVLDTSGEAPSAYQMERHLVSRLLELGRLLLLAFFCAQQRVLEPSAHVMVNGKRLPCIGLRPRCVRSVFGKLRFERSYYYADHQGYFLLDARLNLPRHSASDLLREWRLKLGCSVPYHKSGRLLFSLLGQKSSVRAIEEELMQDCDNAQTFYEQQPAPEPVSEACVLVVQADGKGVPMLACTPTPTRVRLGKGDKKSHKKEAIATAVYTISPCLRTPQQVTNSLFAASTVTGAPSSEKAKRDGPQNKWLWATLSGKCAAVAFAARQAKKRQGAHIRARVALTDGAAPLQFQMQKYLPEFVLVLDIIHAIEYLWEAANRLYGEKSPRRHLWVKERVLQMLQGNTHQIIAELSALSCAKACKKSTRLALADAVRYYVRNLPYMRYDVYLAQGFPIGTGVIEGACRHLVKDRFELSGMRWSVPGAEALLHLRSVCENEDWDAFEAYRQEQRREQLYGSAVAGEPTRIERAAVQARSVETASRAA